MRKKKNPYVELGSIGSDEDITRFAAQLEPRFVQAKWKWYGPESGRSVFPSAARIASTIRGFAASVLSEDGRSLASGGLLVRREGDVPVLLVSPELARPDAAKVILTESWAGNREIICFEVVGERTIRLLPGSFESEGEFRRLHPGEYEFVRLSDWIARWA